MDATETRLSPVFPHGVPHHRPTAHHRLLLPLPLSPAQTTPSLCECDCCWPLRAPRTSRVGTETEIYFHISIQKNTSRKKAPVFSHSTERSQSASPINPVYHTSAYILNRGTRSLSTDALSPPRRHHPARAVAAHTHSNPLELHERPLTGTCLSRLGENFVRVTILSLEFHLCFSTPFPTPLVLIRVTPLRDKISTRVLYSASVSTLCPLFCPSPQQCCCTQQ